MVIIDINKQRVHNEPSFDLDVLVIKGASPDLINNLTRVTAAASASCKTACGCSSKKVPLGGRIAERMSTSVPQSIFAGSGDSFEKVFAKISNVLSPKSNAATVTNTFVNAQAKRNTIQHKIAAAMTRNAVFVEALRKASQASATINADSNTVTSRNVQAAIALYSFYSDDKGFSSTEGSAKIASIVQASPDTISRLATELKVLRKTGNSAATRYFVSRSFGQLLIRTLQNGNFTTLLNEVDNLQDQLDALGSI
jgi:hypothetical protein